MSSFKLDVTQVVKGLTRLDPRENRALQMYVETVASDFEGYAKENRPWTDRTSRARQGLTGYVKRTDKGYRIILAHTVDYGIWLELVNEKRFAILEPTVRLKGPEAVQGLSHLLKRMGG